MKNVAVIIPVYGQWDLVKKNVEALLQFDKQHISEIILMDDCSPEPNPYTFDSRIVKTFVNEKNSGYAGTVNNGLRKASSEILVLLDSDAYPIGSFIPTVIDLFDENENLGSVGFSTVDENGNKTGSSHFAPSVTGYVLGQQLEARYDTLFSWKGRAVLSYSCAIAFRKECLEEVGYFDDINFPVVDSDLDLGLRILHSKWKLMQTEKVTVYHNGGNSYKVNNRRVQLLHEGRWKLLMKHNRIKNPSLIKKMLMARIATEIAFMRVLIILNVNKASYTEKLSGRKALLRLVSQFNNNLPLLNKTYNILPEAGLPHKLKNQQHHHLKAVK